MNAMRLRAAGFTLIEIMVVLVIVGIVGAIAFAKNGSPATYTLLSQGEVLAANLRHTQTLATTWSRSLNVALSSGTNGTYSVSCVTATTASPCNAAPVTDPATGSPFSVSVESSVSISGPSALTIDSSGKPSASATYTLSSSNASVVVTVAATTGFVTVTMQ